MLNYNSALPTQLLDPIVHVRLTHGNEHLTLFVCVLFLVMFSFVVV